MTDYIKIKFKIFFIRLTIKVKKNLFYKFVNKFWKVNSNRIVFANFCGMGYGCNPKYIANEFLNQNLPYELFWVVNHSRTKDFSSIPQSIKQIEIYSLQFWYILMTSKMWIINTTLGNFFNIDKRKEQIYIQTGHGSLGIKKIGCDDKTISSDKKQVILKEAKELNYFISNSKFETEVYSSGFLYPKEKIVELGHARNDILFLENKKFCKKVRDFYGISESAKILLYVPTFRKKEVYNCYNIDYTRLHRLLSEKFSGEWKILVRFHPRTIPYIKEFFNQNENVINATKYEDIQELLAASNIAITDYSSCIFDFMLTGKPAFLYATDYEEFDDGQGCYYPLTSTPFPLSFNNEELFDKIRTFDFEEYSTEVKKFLDEKKCIDDNNSSKRVVSFLRGVLNDR